MELLLADPDTHARGLLRWRTVLAIVAMWLTGGAPALMGQCIVDPSSDRGIVRRSDETRILGTIQLERHPDIQPPITAERQRTLDLKPGGRASLDRSVGYVVSVERADGNAAELLAPGSDAVVFRWGGVNDFCQWTPRRDTLSTGSRQHFIAIRRPDSLWVGDLPTFDVPPEPLGEFPGVVTWRPASLLEDFLDFVSVRPDEEEWKVDCRPPTLAVQSWLDAHPDAAQYRPFNTSARTLGRSCDHQLEDKAYDLERWDAYDEPYQTSEALKEWLAAEGCEDLTELESQREVAFPGQYIPTSDGGEHWLVLCVKTDYWLVLVVLPEPPVKVVELVGMAGTWDWLLTAAPPEYFHFTSAREFDRKEPRRVPRPQYDVALLEFSGAEDDEKLAFFWTETGWRHVVVRCCHWPEAAQP